MSCNFCNCVNLNVNIHGHSLKINLLKVFKVGQWMSDIKPLKINQWQKKKNIKQQVVIHHIYEIIH